MLTRLRRRPELTALGVLLLIGLVLRIYFIFIWRPAITGYSDSGIYFQDAYQGIWTDPIRTTGYAMFLVVLHWVTPHLLLVIELQHLMGLAVAVLLFATVRRIGGPRWLGLIPAAAVALGGDELFIEHAALSETLYILALAAMLYCTVTAWAGGLRWAVAAGLFAGLSVWIRGAGISLLPVIPLWLLFCRRRPTRATATLAAISLAAGVATVGVYVGWRQASSGLSGLTTNGNWNLYGRVAPWADCTKFTPPRGAAGLCDPTPPSQRLGRNGGWYIYNPNSPAQKLFGPPYRIASVPGAMDKLRDFSVAAIERQPRAYLHAVWLDVIRLVDPNHYSYSDLSADGLIGFLVGGPDYHSGRNDFVSYWQSLDYPHDSYHRGDIGPLKSWEKLTRFDGAWMIVLLALCLAAPWVSDGPTRSPARLLAVVSMVLLLFPLFTKGYDYRYVIPAYGPLFATASLAGWGIYVRLRRGGIWRRETGRPRRLRA